MKNKIRIVMADPAQSSDPTGIVGIEGHCPTGKIRVKLAKQFTDKNKEIRLNKTASYLRKIRERIEPDYLGMETNNDGTEIIKKINQQGGVSLSGITTSANLTAKTRRKGRSMDKPFMIKWLATKLRNHDIEFPKKESTQKDMKILIEQIPQIVSQRTPNGSITYKAQRNRHDDLFMALLLCCHIFMIYQCKWNELH